MNIENTQSQMRKGILEFCILSIIRRGEAYPSDIVEEMRAANLHILEGTLYPLLTRLKNADMLLSLDRKQFRSSAEVFHAHRRDYSFTRSLKLPGMN
jgi:DNA-binding PadR family transcriptional regulator